MDECPQNQFDKLITARMEQSLESGIKPAPGKKNSKGRKFLDEATCSPPKATHERAVANDSTRFARRIQDFVSRGFYA